MMKRFAIITDIHGNIEGLNAILKDIENKIVKVEVDELWKNLSYSEEKYTGIIDNIIHLKGNDLTVKDFEKHESGVFPVNTSNLEKRNIATDIEVEENKISKKLYRWIAIKLIDGEEKILKSIQENLELNLSTWSNKTKINDRR